MPSVPNRDETEASQTDDPVDSIRSFRGQVTSQTRFNRILWLALAAIALFSIVILIFVYLDRTPSIFANYAEDSSKLDAGHPVAQISPVQKQAPIVGPNKAASNSKKAGNTGILENTRHKGELNKTIDADRRSRLHVTGSVVNLRAGPSTSHKIVAKLKRGVGLVEIGRKGHWIHIEVPSIAGLRAWIHSSLVARNQVASDAFQPGPIIGIVTLNSSAASADGRRAPISSCSSRTGSETPMRLFSILNYVSVCAV